MKRTVNISIIIPVYNVSSYLTECVESVLKKTKISVEILMVDDGSTDGSEKICDEYASKNENIKVIHKKNGGLGSARNVGLDAASGEYVLFLDSDDYVDIFAIEALYNEAHEKKLDIILLGATTIFEDEESAQKMPKNNYFRKYGIEKICSGLDLIEEEQKHDQYITSVCLRLYRRDYLENGGYRFNETIIHEDVDYSFFTLINAKRVEALDRNCYFRRYRKGSIIMDSQLQKKFEGYEYAWNEFVKYIDSKGLDSRKRNVTIVQSETCVQEILAVVSKMSASERKRFKARLRNILRTAKGYKEQYKKKTVGKIYFPRLYRHFLELKKFMGSMRKIAILFYSEPLFFIKLLKLCIPSNKGRIVLFGTPIHGNSGDHLIALAEMQFLKKHYPNKVIIECTLFFSVLFDKFLKKHILKEDLLFISGGGWLGTEWPHDEIYVREMLRAFPNNCITILPQTIFYSFKNTFFEEGKKAYMCHEHLLFCLRDKKSLEFVEENGLAENTKTVLLPDFAMIFQEQGKKEIVRGKEIKLCFRSDVEKNLTEKEIDYVRKAALTKDGSYVEFDTVKQCVIPLSRRKKYVGQVLREIKEAKLVLTDRLHAMIMCALVGTPCIAYDNTTHKVRNVYHWIQNLSYIHIMNKKDDLLSIMTELSEKDRNDNMTEYQNLNLEYHFEQQISRINE